MTPLDTDPSRPKEKGGELQLFNNVRLGARLGAFLDEIRDLLSKRSTALVDLGVNFVCDWDLDLLSSVRGFFLDLGTEFLNG